MSEDRHQSGRRSRRDEHHRTDAGLADEDAESSNDFDDNTENGQDPSNSGSRRSHRHSSRHRSRRSSSSAGELYKCKRVVTLMKSFIIALILGLLGGAVFMRSYLGEAHDQLAEQRYHVEQMRQQKEQADARLQEVEKELASHVVGNLPDLNSLTYNKVIEVEQKYVKNIVFSVSRKGGETSYEFQLQLHNKSPIVIQPRVKILLFDHTGLQIGIADLKGIKDNVLIPEETRSLHDVFEITLENREPAYFMVIAN